ncbi:ribonuclease HIII [Enterococcus diestrammenae]|uniref:ribonuclease HIII n=1 Tax=Enterococcus diestrammenae TaxID=1155073 RepID=UPI0022E8AE1E|nr:ribonuclease HIII [Enterococcus diestrammenae]
MTQVVLTSGTAQVAQMKEHYQSSLVANKNPYAAFTAKVAGVTITAYRSGKVMFQGPGAQAEAGRWQSAPSAAQSKKTAPKKKAVSKGKSNGIDTSKLPAGFSQWSVAGSDEVGNGSYFGPLVVAAVYADKENLAALKQLGVKDSKMLTDTQIRQLAPAIMKLVPYQKLVVTPEKYNQVQPRYNAVHMKVVLHNQALDLLLKKIAPTKPEAILVDQFTSPANYKKYLQAEPHKVTEKLYFVTKGEQYHLAVAAASILCRASFLEELEKASAEIGMTLPSGAGSKSDQIAARILQKGGLPLLTKYAKLHFANTEKAKKIAGV